MNETLHTTVLLRETVDLVAPRPGGVYADGTVGGGGHAEEILMRSSPDGVLIGIDQDEEALAKSRERLSRFGGRVMLRQGNFRNLPGLLAECGIEGLDGIVLDLGLSWFHLRSPERGFSFQADGPLDMRMNAKAAVTAAVLVNELPRRELARIIREYGEEKRANAVAKAIEQARSRGPITRTVQLAEIVSGVFPPYPPRRIHPATLTFQALRIAVNDELAALREGLDRMVGLLRPGGRLAVISFHSLEDRIVKQFFAQAAKACVCPPRLPVCRCGKEATVRVVTKNPLVPGADEVAANPAARSAKLRCAERLPAPSNSEP